MPKKMTYNTHSTLDIHSEYIQALLGMFSYSSLLDNEGKLLYFSENISNLASLRGVNLSPGTPILDIFNKLFNDKDYVKKLSSRLKRIMHDEEEFTEEDIISWPTETKCVYQSIYKRVMDSNNNFIGIIIASHDITNLRLKEVEKRINDILHSASVPCLIWDRKGNLLAYNKESARVFQIPENIPSEDFGKHFFSIQPKLQPDGRKTETIRKKVIQESLKKGFTQTTVQLLKNDDSPIYFTVNLARISWLSDYRLVVFYHDITDMMAKESEAKEAEERIKLMLDTNPVMCILRDDRGNIIDCNHEAMRILGYSDKADFCKNFYKLSPKFQPDGKSTDVLMAEIVQTLDEQNFIQLERVLLTRTGEPVPLESKIIRIPWKNTHYYLSYSFDLREKKAHEQKLLDITKKTRKAELQKKAAQAANEAKTQFLAKISHEIRTPMNAILGISELLLHENLTHRQLQYAKDAKMSVTALLNIVDDILDVSKWQAGKLSLVPVHYDFNEFIHNIKSTIQCLVENKEITFDMILQEDVSVCLYGDDVRLRQVLLNLLSNAIKFTNEGYVRLLVNFTDTSIKFTISDTGIGIRAENISILFDAFEQFDLKKNRNMKGTGLGLTITKAIVELMDGQIAVDSVYGKGTTFHVEIPKVLGDKSLIKHLDAAETVFYAPNTKVLIVDDNAINLNVTHGILQIFRITVDTALSGKEAIELIQKNKYDLVFMDHMMPEMNGAEATKIIRKIGINTPIIALTADATVGTKEMLFNVGINGYLTKPVTKIELNNVLKKWIPTEKQFSSNPLFVTTTSDAAEDEEHKEFWKRIIPIEELSVSTCLNKLGGQRNLYKTMLRLMIQEIEECQKKLTNLLLTNNMNNFRIEIHAMKGALATIGAPGLSEKAFELERASANMNADFCASNLPPFLEKLHNFKLNLKEAFSTLKQRSDSIEIPPELPHIFERMISAFEETDLFNIDKEMENLNALNLKGTLKDEVEQIKDMVIIMDYINAKERILELLSSQQPAASSQQPAASSQQPAASSQQPAASSQQPAASSQIVGICYAGNREYSVL
jgi:PAS domain S-box-containing protein